MTISTSGNIKDLVERAQQFANNGSCKLTTAHILLAIFTGADSASKTLSLLGLSETQIRTAIRSAGPEPDKYLSDIELKARQFARKLGVAIPSALHLLAAITTVQDCHGYQILKNGGFDTDVIRNQALRNMTTGLTREHGSNNAENPRLRVSSGKSNPTNALPLPNIYPGNHKSASNFNENKPRRESSVARSVKPTGSQRLRLFNERSPLNVGQSLEQAQRKTRAKRSKFSGSLDKKTEVESDVLADVLVTKSDNNTALKDNSNPILNHPKIRDKEQITPTFDFDPSKFPVLESIGRNLTAAAVEGALDEIVGRDNETETITDILNKRRANCPCLIGPPGVGKTAIIEGLALKIAKGEAPGLAGKIIIEVKPGDLTAGTGGRGVLSERFDELKEEISLSEDRVILFFDDLHSLLTNNDAAEAIAELRSSLGKGELPCIVAATETEYNKYVESDPALVRSFEVVDIVEPSEEETLSILKMLAPAYGDHHNVEFTEDALKAAVHLSSRYVPDKVLPDKAVALLDIAGARAQRSTQSQVTANDISSILASQMGIPAKRLSMEDQKNLLNIESDLAAQIVGHPHVHSALGETLRRNAAGFSSRRPIGSFLFLGPTGVGKTETAKVLAEILFADKGAMVRLDMSEFSEPHAVARMVGAPPGYVGHEEGGQLTEAVRRRPYCLVLLDEIEKAHRDVVQVLLQVLDDGRLTDGKGRTVVFENTVVIMTSNLGADLSKIDEPRRPLGFASANETSNDFDIAAQIEQAAKDTLPPELWNRIDEPLVFSPLSIDEVSKIALLLLNNMANRLREERDVTVTFGDCVVDTLIASGGFDTQYGARPMRRTIQRLVEGPLANMVLQKEISQPGSVEITGDGSVLTFTPNTSDLDVRQDRSE